MDQAQSTLDFLDQALASFHCQTGTIHRTGPDGLLHLVAQRGVPDALMEKVSKIPFGKGIAGAAAERREPVELCNLQSDLGGVARPDARQTGVSGSLAVPVFAPADGSVIGTLGVGMFQPHEFSDEEKSRLQSLAADLATTWLA
jgi:putative methionine-R-sulfoxide reductase with GAF domain